MCLPHLVKCMSTRNLYTQANALHVASSLTLRILSHFTGLKQNTSQIKGGLRKRREGEIIVATTLYNIVHVCLNSEDAEGRVYARGSCLYERGKRPLLPGETPSSRPLRLL